MHISGLYIYTQDTAPGGKVRFKQILEHIAARVQRHAHLTRHLKTVPSASITPTGWTTATSTRSFISATSPCPSPATGGSCAS
jgi:hypothetical protein